MGALQFIAGLLPSLISSGSSIGSTGCNIARQTYQTKLSKSKDKEFCELLKNSSSTVSAPSASSAPSNGGK